MAVHDIAMQLDVKVPIRDGGEGTVRSHHRHNRIRNVPEGAFRHCGASRQSTRGIGPRRVQACLPQMGMHPLLPLPPCCPVALSCLPHG